LFFVLRDAYRAVQDIEIAALCSQRQRLAKSRFLPYHRHMVKTEKIKVETAGNCDVVNITEQVSKVIRQSAIAEGTVTVFNVGSTAGITTTEYEPGLVNHDLAAAFEKIAPANGRYEHEETWHDDNGHSHVRASLLGPSLSVPFIDGQMTLGTWQQIILVDFDTKARTRTVICQIVGE
jgi:secondary thiamine-phosphate synthase enzyme